MGQRERVVNCHQVLCWYGVYIKRRSGTFREEIAMIDEYLLEHSWTYRATVEKGIEKGIEKSTGQIVSAFPPASSDLLYFSL
jgi:hypothetical protein